MPAVSNIYINEEYAEFVDAAAASEAEISYCEYGAGAVGEDYFFTFLSPSSPDDPKGYYAALDKSATEENMLNASAVIWLEYCGTSFAFTSSAGKAALESIVDSYDIMTAAGDEYAPIHGYPIDLSDCDIVSVPGHGREECSSPKWYQTLSPSLAVISVGDNYSGYPSAQALADIRGEGTKTASSYLIMSIVGGAVSPVLMGLLGEARMSAGFVLPLMCFIFIAIYAAIYKR